jgi:uncharacterized repeat protein (TIGR02543 family)
MKKLTLLIFSLLAIVSGMHAQTSTTPSGSGTSTEPYQIATADNLYWLSQNSSYWGKCFTQTANIDASGISNFSSIGNGTTNFTGTYNGNGYTISGLTISRSSTSLVGLFGKTNNATISNLGLTGASVSGFHYTGILSGTCNGTTTVSQCFATGTVSSTGSSVGGLIGELASGGTVTNCYAIATVSTTASANIGGLIGFNYATVSYCYASATVTAGGGAIGGLLGNSTTVSTASYYNSGLCSNGSAYATSKTATELQTQSTFSGWDFYGETSNGTKDTWAMSSNRNNGYPCFTWQNIAPTVTTQAVTDITTNSATGNGNLTDLGIPYPTAYGICWSSNNSSPSTSDSKADLGTISVKGTFSVSMSSLSLNTKYYVRAYATNNVATSYGDVVNIVTLPAGSGTSSDPYQIATLNNLYWLSQNSAYWDKYFIQTADIDASGTSSWNNGKGFSPIGNNSVGFSGHYNGNGHILSGLTINQSTSNYIGLFGYVSGASVYSIELSGVTILGANYVGSLAGLCTNNTTITDCYVSGTITGTNIVGGLIGEVSSNSNISKCFSEGTVSGTADNNGGLAGSNYGTIVNSYSTVSITGVNKTGGLAGTNDGNINNCYAIGSINSAGSNKGGIVGYSSGPGAVNNGFYNNTIFTGSTSFGTGKSTAEMQMQNTYTDAGWDFVGETSNGTLNIWAISTELNNKYPCFKSRVPAIEVTTQAVTSIKSNSGTGNGTLTKIGISGYYPLSYGLCWNTTGNPTISDNTINLGAISATGAFTASLDGLAPNTTYYVRAYAINTIDTVYGDQMSFCTLLTGKGTYYTPFQVTSYNDLKTLINNQYYWDKYFIQTADIDAISSKKENIATIGNYSVPFSGHYNGKGHYINNLYLPYYTDQSSVGLFGSILNATIDSLNLSGGSISGKYNVGSIAGEATSSSISYCSSSINILSQRGNIGGLIGSATSTIIKRCSASGSVKDNPMLSGASSLAVAGGLVGFSSSSTITDCYSTGIVQASATVGISSTGYGGGLIGNNESSIVTNCYAVGKVSSSGKNSYAGGLYGSNSSTETNCFWDAQASTMTAACGQGSSTAKGKTTAEMNDESIFINAGWDFFGETANGTEDIWIANYQYNNGYPLFLRQITGPIVSTQIASSVTSNTAILNGTLRYIKKLPITSIGFCYSVKNSSPTLSDSIINLGSVSELGKFSTNLTNLLVHTTYYARAFAIDETDTCFGEVISFISGITEDTKPLGSGTSTDPYQIATPDNLFWLSQNTESWDKYFIQTADINADSSKYWNNATGFTPIGNASVNFKGNYNGKGHTISRIYINLPSQNYIGLFGYLSGATIDSLGIVGGSVTGSGYVGSLAGLCTSISSINNCYASSIITGQRITGGLLAEVSVDSKVNKCYTSSLVSCNSDLAGGFAGCNYGRIINCYSTSSVSGTDKIGGFIGRNEGEVNFCYAAGIVTCNGSNAGGLVGYSVNSVETADCFYDKNIFKGTTAYGTGITTLKMKIQNTFTDADWDFTNIWTIKADSTYPALRAVRNNAPFAFTDTVKIIRPYSLAGLLSNDYDYETLQTKLALKVVSCTAHNGGMNSNEYTFYNSAVVGATDTIVYRVGEIVATGDTLWGNTTTSYLKLINSASYSITYNLSGGANNAANVASYMYGVGITLSDPTQIGYTFNGWYDNADFTGTAITEISTTATGNMTLYAKWFIDPATGFNTAAGAVITQYPNPASDIVYITGAIGMIYLYDINGRLIFTQQIDKNGSISVSSLAAGIYVLKINGKEYKLVKK